MGNGLLAILAEDKLVIMAFIRKAIFMTEPTAIQ